MTEQGTTVRRGAFSGVMCLAGWLCAIGIACVIIEMVTLLPYLENEYEAQPAQSDLGQGQVDLRGMGIMHPGPLGWLGGWGYLASLAWMPLAAWQAFRAKRQGIALGLHAGVLLVLVPTLFLAAQALLRLTPLKYEYPLV